MSDELCKCTELFKKKKQTRDVVSEEGLKKGQKGSYWVLKGII